MPFISLTFGEDSVSCCAGSIYEFIGPSLSSASNLFINYIVFQAGHLHPSPDRFYKAASALTLA
jgi:hypothetical protein